MKILLIKVKPIVVVKVYKVYSIKSILLGLRAKYSIFVQSNNADNLLFLNSSKTNKIQLYFVTHFEKDRF